MCLATSGSSLGRNGDKPSHAARESRARCVRPCWTTFPLRDLRIAGYCPSTADSSALENDDDCSAFSASPRSLTAWGRALAPWPLIMLATVSMNAKVEPCAVLVEDQPTLCLGFGPHFRGLSLF